jgi:hypothetical protein
MLTGLAQGKAGGLCFRVDDNQSIERWTKYSEVFDRYNLKFCFALNLGLVENDKAYLQMVRQFQSKGHELQDHTPDHATQYFTVAESEIAKYLSLPGVDHVSGNTVCLKYDSVSTVTRYPGEGAFRTEGNSIISSKNGAFSDFLKAPDTYLGIFIPVWNTILLCDAVSASNPNDPDTMEVVSLWREKLSLSDFSHDREIKPAMEFLSVFDIRMNHDALSLLARRTIEICQRNGISRPTSWIQPGGRTPQISAQDAARAFGKNLQYTNAATYRNLTLKCFNEINTDQSKQFGMQWGDFYEDASYFSALKDNISLRTANHFVLIGHSHFSALLGSWDDYLVRTDSVLQWTVAKEIPVRTQSQWASSLYLSSPNQYENIFPLLYRDNNDDNVPDGIVFNPSSQVRRVKNTGNAYSRGYSLAIQQPGLAFSVTGLSGIEKGLNTLSYYVKSDEDCEITIEISYPESWAIPTDKILSTVRKSGRYSFVMKDINIPSSVNLMNMKFIVSSSSVGNIHITGIALRKKSDAPITITSTPVRSVKFSTAYSYQLEVIDNIGSDQFRYKMLKSPSWLSIDSTGRIRGTAPKFNGKYSITVEVQNALGQRALQTYDCIVDSPFLFERIAKNAESIGFSVQNLPNPFNPSTEIIISLDSPTELTIDIYNITGQKISTAFSGMKEMGVHSIRWEGVTSYGDPVSTGVYLYTVTAKSLPEGTISRITKKMLLLR